MKDLYDGYSCIFFANRNGKSKGIGKIYYIMTRDDAIAFCSDLRTKLSSGSFFFEDLCNLVDQKGEIAKSKIQEDNGKFDELLAELNISPITLLEVQLEMLSQAKTKQGEVK